MKSLRSQLLWRIQLPMVILSALVWLGLCLDAWYHVYQQQALMAQTTAAVIARMSPAGRHDPAMLQLSSRGQSTSIRRIYHVPQLDATQLTRNQRWIKATSVTRYAPLRDVETGQLQGYVAVELDLGTLRRVSLNRYSLAFLLILLVQLAGAWAIVQAARHLRRDLSQLGQQAGALGTQPVPALGQQASRELLQLQAKLAAMTELQQELVQERRLREARLQELEQQHSRDDDSRQRFQSLITHELRTPLNGIMGSVQILGGELSAQERQDHLRLLNRSAQTLNQLLNQVILLNQLDRQQIRIDQVAADISVLLGRLVKRFEQAAQQKQLSLALSLNQDASLALDATRMNQVLDALLDNAIRFTPSGTIQISSQLSEQADGTLLWRVAIRDTGIGIAPELHQDIFRAFMQVDDGSNRSAEVGGLGLTIASRLMRLMQGQILLDSMPGVGSTFTMQLPVQLWQGRLSTWEDTGVMVLGHGTVVLESLVQRVSRWTRYPVWRAQHQLPVDWPAQVREWQRTHCMVGCLLLLMPMLDDERQWLLNELQQAGLPVWPRIIQLIESDSTGPDWADEQLQAQGVDYQLSTALDDRELHVRLTNWLA